MDCLRGNTFQIRVNVYRCQIGCHNKKGSGLLLILGAITKCAYRLHAAERKTDEKVRNIGQQKCYNDLRKRRRSLAWHEQRASRLKNFALVSARKRAAGRNYSGFAFQTASSVRNAAVRNITRFAGGTRSSAAPAGIKRPSRLGRSCTAHICR